MASFLITTDAMADLPESYVADKQLRILSMTEASHSDDATLYLQMKDGYKPATSAASPAAIRDFFEDALEENKHLLHICFSSALSSLYNNCCLVAKEIISERPDVIIEVVDSLGASLGEGLLVYLALQQQTWGLSLTETKIWIERNKLNIQHLFIVDDLHYLQQGGRISRTEKVIGEILGVRPLLHVDQEGRLVSLRNVRTYKKALAEMMQEMLKLLPENAAASRADIFISHSNANPANVSRLRTAIENILPQANIMVGKIGVAIGAHVGPGTIALFFVGVSR